MSKVLLIGPDTSNSNRYAGGIHHIIQPLKQCVASFYENGINISFFNTERISRSVNSTGRLSIENFRNALKIYQDCLKEVQIEQYDVLIYASSIGLALLKDILIAKQLKKNCKVKIYFQIHSADIDMILPPRYCLGDIIFHQLNTICDGCFFLSNKLMHQFIERGFFRERAYILFNYHNLELCDELVKQKLLGIMIDKKTRLLFIGGFDRRKGLLDLLLALEPIDETLYSIDLCGGYNNDDVELKGYLHDFCFRHRQSCINHGYVTREVKTNILSNADVCVLPSYSEGMPVVLLESMAAGCAILATDVGAISEIIKDGENGILISPGDVSALRNAILSMIYDKERLNKIQNRNYADANQYTIEKYINRLSEIIR